MKRTLICLSAAAFAITLSLFACSGSGGGTSGEEAKGCYVENSNSASCKAIGQLTSESECRETGGEVMDLDDCERAYEAWRDDNLLGSCVRSPICYDMTKNNCTTLGGSFTLGEACPGGDIIGSCTYIDNDDMEDCIKDFSEINCTNIGGAFVLEGKCPGEDIIGSCTIGERCYNDRTQYECPRAGGTFLEGENCPDSYIIGSCTIGGRCYNDTPKYDCINAIGGPGSFVPGEDCPGSDIDGYCTIAGICYTSSKNRCDFNSGTFYANACPGNGSCTYLDYVCWENSSPERCSYTLAPNGLCNETLFKYCYDDDLKICDLIGGSRVSSKSECLNDRELFLASLSYCQDYEVTIRN
jgi:hypothetical protein